MDGDPSSRGEAAQARSFLVTRSGGRARAGKLHLRLRYRCGAALRADDRSERHAVPGVQFLDGRDRTGHDPDALPAGAHRLQASNAAARCSERDQALRRDLWPRSPDHTLRRAPIGTAITHPWLFPLEKRFYDIPLVRYAAPLRDRVVFGRYQHLASPGLRPLLDGRFRGHRELLVSDIEGPI